MRTNNLFVLCLAIVMGGVAAFLARSWLQSHARASLGDESIGTIVVAAQPLGFGTTLTAESVAEIAWAARSLPAPLHPKRSCSNTEPARFSPRSTQRAGTENENHRAGSARRADGGSRRRERSAAIPRNTTGLHSAAPVRSNIRAPR